MANLRDIRNRIESIKNTQQITRAMKMVAAAKLRKAQDRIEEMRPYASKMQEVTGRMISNASEEHPLLSEPDNTENILFIVIGSDRGLCGAFNNNLFKEVEKTINEDFSDEKESGKLQLLCIGRQAATHYEKRDYQTYDTFPGFWDDIAFNHANSIMKSITDKYISGEIDQVKLAYNEFKSVIAQNRIVEQLLPIDGEALTDEINPVADNKEYIFEPDVDHILKKLLPQHLNLQLWKSILESNAAEQGARMTAMDNATENAQEMKEDLELEYNRARQSAITTEISEIISGAQALEDA